MLHFGRTYKGEGGTFCSRLVFRRLLGICWHLASHRLHFISQPQKTRKSPEIAKKV